jgi:predicted nucleic acid-binding protein
LTPRVFVDTNVLVYLRDSTEPDKQRRAAEWIGHLWESGSGRLSLQVLQEYYVTMTRKLEPGLAEEEAREDVVALEAWSPLLPDMDLLASGWAEQDRYGFSFWDALIVAAARRLGCAIVLTEDLQDGQDLGGMVVQSPFTTRPDSGVS